MRDIIFRGKRKDNGEWVEGCYATIQNPFSEDGRPVKHLICNGTNVFNYEIIPETVGQYTGLYDKNGKKIFEGDIIREQYGCGYDDFRVEFVLGGFNMIYIRTNQGKYAWYGENGEVVGNIHDNPELLERGE